MIQTTLNDGGSGHRAVGALADLGPSLGWGLLSAGVIWGSSRAIQQIAEGPATAPRYAGAILEALAIALAAGLAGRAAAVACGLAGAIIEARAEPKSGADGALLPLADRAVAAFERLADVLERRPIATVPTGPTQLDRTPLLAEIDQAIRSRRRDEAESLLDGYIKGFPDDPTILHLRERLDALRREESDEHLAQIRAAREVNDAPRVLELYRGVEPYLERNRRGELERELSRWFLELIHRRLRGGRIQRDVVELATTVAETFASTMEGASLRASLPTLRRSVGLCPRCAQPYVGTAAACPQCLAGSSSSPAPGGVPRDSEPEPDPDDPSLEPRDTPSEGRVAGGMFYDEDDGDDRVPPA